VPSTSLRRLRSSLPFIPSAVLLCLALFSTVCLLYWQGSPGSFRRVRLYRGSPMGPWMLGTDLTVNRVRVTTYADWTGWPPQTQELLAPVVVRAGDIHLPILYLALIAAAPPAAVRISRRFRRRPPHACARCGYDRRGLSSSTCPECGSPAP
jgi:hypothetical protein